jgi:zinc/manganese transport system permease protein
VTLYEALIGPFADFPFMRRALAGCAAIALGAAPVGVFLVLRRMSLIGDAMAHAILPGAAIAFLFAGFSLLWMTVGGLAAGLIVALLSGAVARTTAIKEDASLASFYLLSLSLGVLIVSTEGSNVDLMHVLFGTVLALDDAAVITLASIATLTVFTLALVYRPLVVECFDPGFGRAVGGAGALIHFVFLALVVLNLVGGFQALGTLMAVGLMMLPAASARFWSDTLGGQMAAAAALGLLSAWAGLLVSFHFDAPSGPAIILTCGVFYLVSLGFGPRDSLIQRVLAWRHLEA